MVNGLLLDLSFLALSATARPYPLADSGLVDEVDGEWVEAPPLPEDYYENPESARAYDEAVSNHT